MNDFKYDKWYNFKKDLHGKELYIWGAGRHGKEIARFSKAFYKDKIKAFIDSNPELNECEGYTVIHPEQLSDLNKENSVILISTDNPGKIAPIIEKNGFSHYYSYFWMNEFMKDYRYQPNIDDEAINKFSKLLMDQKSKDLLDIIVQKRKRGDLDYTDIKDVSSPSEYFRDEFFIPEYGDEVFIDGGGFDGDTVGEFILWTGGRYKKIYSFEPDTIMADKIRQKATHWHDVEVIEKGLWDSESVQKFTVDNSVYSSNISDNGSSQITTTSIDKVLNGEKCTFIKMDIEGSEMEALKGAKNTIMRYKPRLAICIYHKPDDLWRIPLLIHEMVPEYKFHIRHYGVRYFSTVLYACNK